MCYDTYLSKKNNIYGVYNAQHVTGQTVAVVSPYTGLGLRNDENTNHTLSLSYTRIFSDRLVNEARGGFNRQDQFRLSNTTLRSFLQSAGFNDADITAYGAVTGGGALENIGDTAIQLGNFALFLIGGGIESFTPWT